MTPRVALDAKGDSHFESGCAVCHAPLSENVAVRLGKSGLYECRSCGSWTLLPRVTASEQAEIHDDADYFEHPYFKLRREITPRIRGRCRDVFARLSSALEIAPLRGERFLDIGCDTGTFLKTAQEEFGIVPVGVDVAERAVRVALSRGVDAFQGRIEKAPAELTGFRAATAIDLIEHVPDPCVFLIEVRKRLRPGGVLYLETPNIRSSVYRFGKLLSSVTGGRPEGLFGRLFPPQHIQYFTPRSLPRLIEDAGFKTVKLGTRVLPAADIAAGFAVKIPLGALQAYDKLLSSEILIWAVLKRPE